MTKGDAGQPQSPQPTVGTATPTSAPAGGAAPNSPPDPFASHGLQPLPWSRALPHCVLAGRRRLALQFAMALLQAALPLVGLLAMQQLVDAVADGTAGRRPPTDAADAAVLATVFAGAVALFGGLLRSAAAIVAENHGRLLADRSVQRAQDHIARLPVAAFDRPEFHDGMQRALAEAGQRPVRLSQDLVALAVAGGSLLLMATVLAQVDLWLPLLVGAAAAPVAWIRRRHARQRYQWQLEHTVEQREIGWLGAALTGRATAKDVRVHRLLRPFGGRLVCLRHALRESMAALAFRRGRDEWLVHVLASAALFFAYFHLAGQALAGAMTLGGLVLHAQAAQRTQNAVRDLLQAHASVTEDRLFLQPLAQLLAMPIAADPANDACGAGASVPLSPPAIEARDVSFGYPQQPRPVLDAVSFALPPGARLCIVGANGSGKSTLLKLLVRLYEPTAGGFMLGAAPLARCDRATLRGNTATLLQDAHCFELTIRDNLCLGHTQPTGAGGDDSAADPDARCWQALAAVGLDERVRALPAGLATPCSRRLAGGIDWSGGEARRLVIARALAQPADLLLLDEPFASLDVDSEARLARHLEQLPRDRTLVVADHRPAAFGLCDHVLWLQRGRVAAFGERAAVAARADFRAAFPGFG